MSATITQVPSNKAWSHPIEEPCTFMPLDLGDMPPIPMPAPNHPAGEQVHPWED